jgi:DNA-binding transcriptional regulator YhcF (GntR family)
MPNVQKPPSIELDPGAREPLVQQLENSLRQALVSGQLQAGERLPSSRALARDLGIHFNTVAQAYRTLESEGWLALKRRAGTIVLERPSPLPDAAEIDQLQKQYLRTLAELLAEYRSRGLDAEQLKRVTLATLEGVLS